MRFHVQYYIFEGPYKEYKVSELMEGFENPYAYKINGGDFFAGNDFSLSAITTPYLND